MIAFFRRREESSGDSRVSAVELAIDGQRRTGGPAEDVSQRAAVGKRNAAGHRLAAVRSKVEAWPRPDVKAFPDSRRRGIRPDLKETRRREAHTPRDPAYKERCRGGKRERIRFLLLPFSLVVAGKAVLVSVRFQLLGYFRPMTTTNKLCCIIMNTDTTV